MKKWIALLLAVVMVFALAACTDKNTEETSEDTGASQSTTADAQAGDSVTDTTGTTGSESESSSGDMIVDLPATNADLSVDETIPASDGDLTDG